MLHGRQQAQKNSHGLQVVRAAYKIIESRVYYFPNAKPTSPPTPRAAAERPTQTACHSERCTD